MATTILARIVPLAFIRRHRAALIPLAFVLPFVAVVVEFALIHAGFGEPYPAIIMPDFRGTGGNPEGVVNVTVVDIEVTFADRSAAHPSLATLLAPMPSSMFAAVSSRNFRATPTSQLPPRTGLKAWLVVWQDRSRHSDRLGAAIPGPGPS